MRHHLFYLSHNFVNTTQYNTTRYSYLYTVLCCTDIDPVQIVLYPVVLVQVSYFANAALLFQLALLSMAFQMSLVAWALIVTWLGLKFNNLIFNLYFHPLRKYPGPLCAAATTWWRTYIEVFKKESWTDALVRLHERYGM